MGTFYTYPQISKPTGDIISGQWVPSTSLYGNLVAHWNLNETGDIRYDMWNTHNLTDNNTVSGTVGKIGNAALFVSGNNEYLSTPANGSISNHTKNSFTITCWVYPSANGATTSSVVSDWGASLGVSKFCLYYHNILQKFVFTIVDQTLALPEIVPDNTSTLAQWHFVVAQYNTTEGKIKLWADHNYNTANFTNGINLTANRSVYIGTDRYDNYFYGKIDATSLGILA